MNVRVEQRIALQEQRAGELAERVARLLGPFRGDERALDSGCGAGAFAFALAPHVREVHRVLIHMLCGLVEERIENGRQREIPMTPTLIETLKERSKSRFTGGDARSYVFTRHGKRLRDGIAG